MDIIENNGNCLAQTTWHTWANQDGDCDQHGCRGKMYRSGRTHVKAEFSTDGWMAVYMDGTLVNVNDPIPSEQAQHQVHHNMHTNGVQIQSSQWVGWVPKGRCAIGGNLQSSSFSIENIVV